MVGWLVGWFVDWLFGELLVGWLLSWLVSWLVGWLDDWLVGWLDGWLVGWLIGWIVGWLVGCFVLAFKLGADLTIMPWLPTPRGPGCSQLSYIIIIMHPPSRSEGPRRCPDRIFLEKKKKVFSGQPEVGGPFWGGMHPQVATLTVCSSDFVTAQTRWQIDG